MAYTVNRAGFGRFASCMDRARRGQEMSIGFLGGSITQGSPAEKEENTYAYRVYTWWKKTFPGAEFHYVNAGIGGTKRKDIWMHLKTAGSGGGPETGSAFRRRLPASLFSTGNL